MWQKNTITSIGLAISLTLLSGCGGDAADTPSESKNQAPIALAGTNQYVNQGDTVILDGANSFDKDGDIIRYQWSFIDIPEESQAVLKVGEPNIKSDTVDKAGPAISSFIADVQGTYIAELIVNDGQLDSRPNQVKISVGSQSANLPPSFTLRDDISGNLVYGAHIRTHAKDPDNDPLFHQFEILSQPEGSHAFIRITEIGDTVWGTLKADMEGEYGVQVSVSDGFKTIVKSTIVNIVHYNYTPFANTHPNSFGFLGDEVTVDGSASSDQNNDPLTYQWSFISVPMNSNAAFADPTAMTTTFTADVVGTYLYQLVVNDGYVDSKPNRSRNIILGENTPQIRIYELGNTKPSSMPYYLEQSIDLTDQPLKEEYSLGKWRLEAVGHTVTISGVRVYGTEMYQPYFNVLKPDKVTVIQPGESLEIEILAPATNGATEEFSIGFYWSLEGTGSYSMLELFNARYQLTTP